MVRLGALIGAALFATCTYTMPQDMHIKPGGLFTDSSPHSSVPAGALRRADNIVIRRDGVAEPRPGFEAATLTSPPAYVLRQMIAYDGDVLIASSNGGAAVMRWLSDTSAAVTASDDSYQPDSLQQIFGAEARGNLYLTNASGVARITGGGTNDADIASPHSGAIIRAGNSAPPVLHYTAAPGGTVVANGSAIAYRCTIETKNRGSELSVVSMPSGRVVYDNTTGGTIDLTLRVYLGYGHRAGDIIRIYRSPVTTATSPDDNMQLVWSYTLLTADVSAGYVSHTDSAATDELGAFLYTSPNQEGIEGANTPPPGCTDIAEFRGSLFASDIVGPYSQTVTFDAAGAISTDTGIGSRALNVTRTNGSATMAMASTTGMRVGQIVARASWSGTGVVRIVSIVANTSVTMNETWGGVTDGAPTPITFYDTINVGGQYFPIDSVSGFLVAFAQGIASLGVTTSTYFFAVPIGDAMRYVGGSANIGNAQILISERWPEMSGATVPEIWATHGDEYKPAIATAAGADMERDDIQNGIAWSKQDQPEHWPLYARARIGGGTHPILRIVPTRDALWIFKTDGIWRLTGNGSPAWRIDPVDMTTFLISPKAVAVMDDTIYAWTNHGIVAVSDAGIQRFGALAIGSDLHEAEITLGVGNVTTPGVFAVANPKDNEVIFGVCSTEADTAADSLYVYNTKTQAWTKWDRSEYSCGVFDPSDSKLKFGKGGSYAVDTERLPTSATPTADYSYSITVGAQSGYSMPITSASVVPLAGDLVRRSTDAATTLVTAVTPTGGNNYTLTVATSGFDNDSTFTLLRGYESCIEPVARTGNNPSLQKHWRDGSWVFGRFDGIERVTLSHTSDLSGAASSETRSGMTPTTGTQPRPMWFRIPRAHARASQYWPRLCIRQAGSEWTVEQVSVFYEQSSQRVKR